MAHPRTKLPDSPRYPSALRDLIAKENTIPADLQSSMRTANCAREDSDSSVAADKRHRLLTSSTHQRARRVPTAHSTALSGAVRTFCEDMRRASRGTTPRIWGGFNSCTLSSRYTAFFTSTCTQKHIHSTCAQSARVHSVSSIISTISPAFL